MPYQKRKRYTPQFKFDRSLEAFRKDNLSEISRKYNIGANLISKWKSHLTEQVGVLDSKKEITEHLIQLASGNSSEIRAETQIEKQVANAFELQLDQGMELMEIAIKKLFIFVLCGLLMLVEAIIHREAFKN